MVTGLIVALPVRRAVAPAAATVPPHVFGLGFVGEKKTLAFETLDRAERKESDLRN